MGVYKSLQNVSFGKWYLMDMLNNHLTYHSITWEWIEENVRKIWGRIEDKNMSKSSHGIGRFEGDVRMNRNKIGLYSTDDFKEPSIPTPCCTDLL